jgi:YVTN family beta-propeller protein
MNTLVLLLAVITIPRPAAVPSGTLVVANMGDNTASIIDVASRRTVATVPTGAGPHEVAISHDGRWAVVSNYGVRGAPGNSLTVIDVVRAAVARTIDLGEHRRPHSAQFLPGDAVLAVTSEASRAVLLIDFATGRVDAAVPTNAGGSHMLALVADGKRAFTSNVGDGTVSELDLAGRAYVRTIPVAPRVEGIAVTPTGELVWAGSNVAKTVSVIDTRTGAVTRTYPGYGFPYRMAVTPDGKTAVICDPELSKVHFIGVQDLSEAGVLDVPADSVQSTAEFAGSAAPEGLIISRDGRSAYVALQGSSRVAEIDIQSRAITGYMKVGGSPDGIGYSQLVTGK